MKKLLHIIATPKKEDSRTLRISNSFISEIKKKYSEIIVETVNVFEDELPDMTISRVNGKYTIMAGKELEGDIKKSWEIIEKYINQFLSADLIVISTPMWNFFFPYKLKQYLDIILQPRYMFRYTATGVEGLAKNKKMVVISSRGGDYGTSSPANAMDFMIPYLRSVMGFIGIKDIKFVSAQPMDALGPEVMNKKIEEAIAELKVFSDTL